MIAQTQEMIAQGNAQTREQIAQTREMAAQGDTQTRELISHTRELLMQEFAALRDHFDAQHAEKMAALQRLTDGSLPHSHDIDGTIRFRVLPPAAAPLDRQEP